MGATVCRFQVWGLIRGLLQTVRLRVLGESLFAVIYWGGSHVLESPLGNVTSFGIFARLKSAATINCARI